MQTLVQSRAATTMTERMDEDGEEHKGIADLLDRLVPQMPHSGGDLKLVVL